VKAGLAQPAPDMKLVDMLPMLIGGDSPALSPKQIAERMGRNSNAVRLLVKNLHQESRVHIAGWERTRGSFTALWKWGPGIDAEPLKKITNAEACRAYKATKNGKRVHNKSCRRWYRENDGAAYKRAWNSNQKALKAYSQHGVKAIDPLLAAIMGAK
jgi:hypothetical protein